MSQNESKSKERTKNDITVKRGMIRNLDQFLFAISGSLLMVRFRDKTENSQSSRKNFEVVML